MKERRNRILAVLLTVLAALVLLVGVGKAFAASRRKTVIVVPAGDLNYSWGDYENSMEGMVVSGAAQDIYLSDTESVAEVLVETGQAVKEGDILLKYDAAQTAINLDKELLAREKLQLQLEVAQKNLATLTRMRPASGGGDFVPSFPEPEVPEEPDYTDVKAEKKLDGTVKPYNKGKKKDATLGTEENPYRYLCSEETVITGEFLNDLRQQAMERTDKSGDPLPLYFMLEVREGDTTSGALKKAWIMDASTLDVAPEGWEGSVNLSGDVPGRYSDVTAHSRLEAGTEPYNNADDDADDPIGSDTNPYRFLCTRDAVITGAFLNKAASMTGADGSPAWYVLEVRDGDRGDGDLLLSWKRRGSGEETYPEDAEYHLAVTLQEAEQEDPGTDPEDPGTDPSDPSGQEGQGDGQGPGSEGGSGSESGAGSEGGSGSESGSGSEGGSGTEGGPGSEGGSGTEGGPGQGSGSGSQGQNGNGTEGSGGSGEQGQTNSGSGGQEGGSAGGQGQESGNTAAPEEQKPDAEPNVVGMVMRGTAGSRTTLVLDVTGGQPVILKLADGDTELIPSDAVYTKEELAQARREAEQTIRSLELDLRESEISIKAARRALEEGVVRASMDGTVTTVSDPKDPPNDGSPFLTVISKKGQYIESGLNELYLGTVEKGDPVYLTSYMDGSSFEGTIQSVSPYPAPTGRYGWGSSATYYPMIISVTDPSVRLSEGDYLEVRVDSSAHSILGGDGGTFYLWKAFIRDENGQKYVYKDDGGRLVRQNIRVGGISGESYEILSGVTPEDYLAFPYGNAVKEGAVTRQGTVDELYQ